jgi:hypothetical protein
MSPETSQTIHDEKWQSRIDNFEALIKGLALSVCALAVLFILAPAIWVLLPRWWQGVVSGAVCGFFAGALTMAIPDLWRALR